VIGGATLWAFCSDNEYVTAGMAEDGDDLILTKSAGYGATSVLARAFPQTVKRAIGPALFAKARKYFEASNTVKDSITAASSGIHEMGVTAMHDATEGGVTTAFLEMAGASGLGGIVWLDDIPISDETKQLCKFFRIDPLVSLGEGSLVVACKPHRTSAVMGKLRSKGIDSTVVGRLSSKLRVVYAVTKEKRTALHYPTRDPYWLAYWRAVGKGWS
jgi:hydrogenase expression/formation protein HypE